MFSIYNPYPERSTIEISGVYIEKNGKYLPDLTETFSSEIKEDLKRSLLIMLNKIIHFSNICILIVFHINILKCI